MTEFDKNTCLIIPPSRLEEEVLISLIEEFVSREGTDYGATEVSFQVQSDRAKQALLSGEVLIVFDTVLESCQLISREVYEKISKETSQKINE